MLHSEHVRDGFLCEAAWRAVTSRLALSSRETEIVHLIVVGYAERHIARSLSISPGTVHTHLVRLYEKLHVNSQAQLVARIAREHLDLVTTSPPPAVY